MQPAPDTVYTPISTADAVIRYAENFAPSWAGAIAIDLLPGVLVLILAITQAAIRSGKGHVPVENTLSLAEVRAALLAVQDMEELMQQGRGQARVETAGELKPVDLAARSDKKA